MTDLERRCLSTLLSILRAGAVLMLTLAVRRGPLGQRRGIVLELDGIGTCSRCDVVNLVGVKERWENIEVSRATPFLSQVAEPPT